MALSFAVSRAHVSRVLGIPACSIAFAAVLGCHKSTVVAEPSLAERPQAGSGESLSGQGSDAIDHVVARQAKEHAVGQIEELLEGRFAGVNVIRTASGGFVLRVRGLSTFLGRAEPLYVVDGTPVEVNPERGLDWINPSDIQRITVLKGPPETTLYGVRGANGVVVITTRIR